jgi:hypothetical protein
VQKMAMQKTKKMLPLKAERKETVAAWLRDVGLPGELNWDGEKHASCPCLTPGNWVFMSFGDYQGADWQHRLYISHRCSRCGIMVQHNQVLPVEGAARPALQRLVVLP